MLFLTPKMKNTSEYNANESTESLLLAQQSPRFYVVLWISFARWFDSRARLDRTGSACAKIARK